VKVSINEARELLLKGEVVAIPTETVYGLGGWIKSLDGLKKIFSTKERPFFDPLIVHVDGIDNAKKLTSDWTLAHECLARACWPGPLTLIAKKNDEIDPLITAGLEAVGLRCPRHSETLKLLSLIPGGVAAPSANKFGKTSPTTSDHVADEFGMDMPILEGGPCEVGIESTVAGIRQLPDGFAVEIYRPGFFTASMLKGILEKAGIKAFVEYAESPVAPGQLKHHYMPKIPLIIIPDDFYWERDKKIIEDSLGKPFKNPAIWDLPEDAHLASRSLYQDLRNMDGQGFDVILVHRAPHQYSEEWLGIWNRLEKAKSLKI
jgi:L-threonylcarbamoyladenylate synthase